jgi:hypothetical protein
LPASGGFIDRSEIPLAAARTLKTSFHRAATHRAARDERASAAAR